MRSSWFLLITESHRVSSIVLALGDFTLLHVANMHVFFRVVNGLNRLSSIVFSSDDWIWSGIKLVARRQRFRMMLFVLIADAMQDWISICITAVYWWVLEEALTVLSVVELPYRLSTWLDCATLTGSISFQRAVYVNVYKIRLSICVLLVLHRLKVFTYR